MSACSKQFDIYQQKGWCVFDHDAVIEAWVSTNFDTAFKTINEPQNKEWFRYADTWFVGVNVFHYSPQGVVNNKLPLSGRAVGFIEQHLTHKQINLDKGQLSVCYLGYPKGSLEDAGFSYRLHKDAAHVDGLLKEGSQNRYCREYHDYILAIPMVDISIEESPLVVWNSSHKII